MNTNNIPSLISDAIKHIAPEIEMSDIDPDEDLREECDLDSMDFRITSYNVCYTKLLRSNRDRIPL